MWLIPAAAWVQFAGLQTPLPAFSLSDQYIYHPVFVDVAQERSWAQLGYLAFGQAMRFQVHISTHG